jgi:hypothetical protein
MTATPKGTTQGPPQSSLLIRHMHELDELPAPALDGRK